MLIKNYGLFWKRAWMHTGAGRNAGHLKGVRIGARRGDPVDFREQQGVYCLYDDNFRLIYVGQAGRSKDQKLFLRLKQHRVDHLAERWTKFSWFGIRPVDRGILQTHESSTKPNVANVLNHIEGILIAATEPVHNRQGGRFGKGVEQYLQWRDDKNIAPDTEQMIFDIWNKQNS